MHSTNGHGPKRAILYARVSTDEQARSGYSLAQQIEALRDYAAREGYEVLEEVLDPGQSGASLERPGMDRVRDMVSSSGISAVFAHDRDRISREPAYLYILKTEFEAKGCTLRVLNDHGDDSLEGQLTNGILDQLAKFEREKFKERSRRGKMRKAREDRISVTYPKYGFRFKNDNRTELVVYEPEMLVLKKLFELATEGHGLAAICSRLSQEGIRTPRGCERWDQRAVRRIIFCDMYKPHTYSEVKKLTTPEAAASLDPDKEYGIHFANQTKVSYSHVSEPDGNGGKKYRKSKTTAVRPREEWIAVPVPAYLSRVLIEQARKQLKAHKPTERKYLT